ncbi:hypothetical protein [Streptomyces sp. 142MFCol3.1]|uniref:hypothetical protein n=1 Tax=Streptomyces sp. 142MFCol3.1 TaxID=1172179 RepID=UPI00048FE8A2|nr:hypothetical protein [Streptomyces sp. 142MFCol3.1]
MLALRLARGAQPLVQVRRLLVAAASTGTGFLLLCTLGYAMTHPGGSTGSALRLAWCAVPVATTVYFAVAVARTDPGTRPRPGLAAIGLGPGRLMAISAATTALSTTLGSLLALLLFLHLRGDLTGMPVDGAAAEFLAPDSSLPLPAALTLLALVPIAASAAVAVALRPRGGRPRRVVDSYGRTWITARQIAAGGSASRAAGRTERATAETAETDTTAGYAGADAIGHTGARAASGADGDTAARAGGEAPGVPDAQFYSDILDVVADDDVADAGPDFHWTAEAYGDTERDGTRGGTLVHADTEVRDEHGGRARAGRRRDSQDSRPDAPDTPEAAEAPARRRRQIRPAVEFDPRRLPPVETTPGGLPWGAATVAAGLAVETYAGRSPSAAGLTLPGGFADGPAGVLVGWVLTALGLAMAGPALTYLCGRLLQAVRPGALRLLAGRVLQAESRRIGQPLGVVCAVACGGYAMATLYTGEQPGFGPLATLGALLVAGSTLLTLATAAVEAKQARADTTAALLRLGAPATVLRGAVALRVAALFALFAPLTWVIAELAALPLMR